MTGITLGAGGNMCCRLAQRCCAVVTGRTVACCSGVVGIRSADPGCRRLVAGVALRRGREVGGRFCLGVDRRICSAVTTRTIAGCDRPGGTAMVHGRRRESSGVGVTGVALGCARNVIGRFTQGRSAVVAGRAAASNRRRGRGMIEGAGRPAYGRVVAGITLSRGRNMCRGLHLRILGNESAAVTVRARTLETGVVHHRRRPCHKAICVAGVALGNSWNMVDRFGQRIGVHIAAAVAGGTLAGRSRMAHPRRLEGRETGVAGVALRADGDVVGRFAQCCCAVVAGGALAVGAGVVRINSRRPGKRRGMAGIALSSSADVRHRFHLGILGQIGAAVTGRTQTG